MSRILVVDDDELVRDVVTHQLGSAGHEVVCAVDGEAGLQLALEETFDLVLLDSMMPRLSGVDVCRRLRDDDRTRRVPIVMLTVRSQEADVQRGFAAGADDYVAKPFSPRELVSRVAAILGKSTAEHAATPLDRDRPAVTFEAVRDDARRVGAEHPAALERFLAVVLQVEVAARDARERYDDEIDGLERRLASAWSQLEGEAGIR